MWGKAMNDSRVTRLPALSREIPVVPAETALLFIDVQNYNCLPEGGEYQAESLTPAEALKSHSYFFDRLRQVAIPNMKCLLASCRRNGIEVTYTVIESLTKDGRDRSLDYKITGFNVPKGSWDARVIDEIEPLEDEIVFSKTSSSVFISTNIHYVLGNLGINYLVVCGCLTDQCVSSTVRDACDLGYLVTLITDACVTHSRERHDLSIDHIKGYCRRRTTAEFVEELKRFGSYR
jgi:ureidoacrylate peracid hydrolase